MKNNTEYHINLLLLFKLANVNSEMEMSFYVCEGKVCCLSVASFKLS